jgi:hypothetical protein
MIINLAKRAGDALLLEEIDDGVMFEGSQPQPGVIVTFHHEGREISARIVDVTPPSLNDPAGADTIVTIEEIDPQTHDRESERTLEELPPDSDMFAVDDNGQEAKLPPRKPV